jgi:hypothetical protein
MDPISQPWYATRTVWAGIVGVGISAFAMADKSLNLTGADQQTIVDSLTAMGTAISGLAAIYYRIIATKSVGSASTIAAQKIGS